jgi:hypothetical protein
LGPLGALAWLLIRPRTKLAERLPNYYVTAEDALAAVSRLEMLGEWGAAIGLYHNVAERWPEHQRYVDGCVRQIRTKQSLA